VNNPFLSNSEALEILDSGTAEFQVEWAVETDDLNLEAAIEDVIAQVASRNARWRPHSLCGPVIGRRACVTFWREVLPA